MARNLFAGHNHTSTHPVAPLTPRPVTPGADISVSIVLYKNTVPAVRALIDTVMSSPRVRELWLIDHSPQALAGLDGWDSRVIRIHDPQNPGFGAGHNRALRESVARGVYHAVLNPDILMPTGVLDDLAEYLDRYPKVGAAMPTLYGLDGRIQNQGRLLPTPWNLVERRWLHFLRGEKRRYELNGVKAAPIRNVPNLSGAFLFLRCQTLLKCGLFDERFFLYCEDVDLVRRIHALYRTEVLRHLRVIHLSDRASYRSWRLTLVHSVSAVQYFSKWGWFVDPQRKRFNRAALP